MCGRKRQCSLDVLAGRPSLLAPLVLAAALALCAGCSSDDSGGSPDAAGTDGSGGASDTAGSSLDGRPPAICRTPEPLGAGPYFKDITAAAGLDSAGLALQGNRLASADINGDGLPDLIVHRGGSNNRDKLSDSPPVRYKRLLINKGPGATPRFEDVTDKSGYTAIRGGGSGRASHFAIFADIDNDGTLDAFSGTYVDANPNATLKDPGDRNEILLGDGKGGFKLGPKSGVFHKEMFSTTSATFLDYDRDGNLDVFVGYFYEIYGRIYSNQDRLYRGNGDGTFTDVTDKVGLTLKRDSGFADGTNTRPTYGVTACDIDGDGDQDLLVSAYGRQWNLLWRNDGGKFVEIGRQSGFAGDGNYDFADNQFYRCYCQSSGKCQADAPVIGCSRVAWTPGSDDKPWRNNGNTFTTLCGDFDNDGDIDVYNAEIRHWHIGKSSDASQFLVNAGGKTLKLQRPGTKALGLARVHQGNTWDEGDISAALFDFDGDGLQDLILMSSDYPNTRTLLYRQKPDHTFEEIASKAGIARDRGQEVTVADFDGDGDLDVMMGTSSMRGGPKVPQVFLYENLVGNKSNYTKITLVGAGAGRANRSAIGARVIVKIGDQTLTREVTGGYGHFGLQNDLTVHFGLGAACEIDSIEVRWPDKDNSVSRFTNVRANYPLRIEQAGDKLTYITAK